MNNKVVLAFSGGLDTSFCVPYLKNEKGLEVHTVMVNTGGFSKEEEKEIEQSREGRVFFLFSMHSITNRFNFEKIYTLSIPSEA